MENKGVSTKQFAALVFLVGVSIKAFMLPSLILRVTGKDGYLIILGYIAVEFIGLGLVVAAAVKHPNETFFEMLEGGLGAVAARIFVAFLIAFAAIKCVIVVSEIKMFFSAVMYRDVNWAILAIPLFALLVAFAARPLFVTGRTAELTLPAVVISTLILASLLFGDVRPSNLLPVLPNGLGEVVRGACRFSAWFGDTAVFALFLGNIKLSPRLAAGAFVSKTIAALVVGFFVIATFASYADVSSLVDYGNNVSNMTQLSLGSQDYGRFDLLFYCVWLFGVLITLGLYFRLITRSVAFVVAREESFAIAAICAVVLYAITAFVVKNAEAATTFATSLVGRAFYPIGALAVPLALVCERVGKRRRKRDES